MSGLPRPDLPPGAHRDLVLALHDLHHHAGWPSLRRLARDTGVSHTTVSKAFSQPALPTWGTLELLVEAMGGDVAHFHELWLAASTPTNGAGATPRIAGRRAELDVVRHHLETGTGLLLVTGEAGMGKTKLVTTAADIAAERVLVARGACLPLSSEVPLLPIGDALRTLYAVEDGRWMRACLDTCPDYVAAAIAPVLPELTNSEDPRLQADQWSRHRLFAAVGAALGALVSARAIAVLIEDLHWADESTLDLLSHLVAAGVNCPVVGTWRLDDATTSSRHVEWFERVGRLPTVRHLELRALSEDDTAQQLGLLGVDNHDGMAARVYRRTKGQPLFTEQLSTQLEDDAPFPRVLSDLLDRRFAGISDAAWSLTRVLGVADRPLTASQLATATGLMPSRLAGELHDLQRHQLVRTTHLGAAELQHPLLAEATRRRLVAGEANEVHTALAEVLGAEADASPAEVAAHWEGAAEPEREIEWRIAAARASAEGYATAMEADQWLRALEIWPETRVAAGTPSITRAEAYIAAMDALRVSLQFDRAAEMSDEAEHRLGDLDPTTRAELLRRAADLRGQREGADVGLALIEEALLAHESLPVYGGMVKALLRKAALLQAKGQYAEASDVCRIAVPVAEHVGDARLHRQVLSWVAWHEGSGGSPDRAVRTMHRAASLVPADSDPEGDIRQAVLLTDLLLLSGGDADAIDAAGLPGLLAAERWGIESYHALLVRSNMVSGRIRSGRVDQAADLVEAASQDQVDADRWPLHLDRAVVDALRGDGDLARERIGRLLDVFQGRVIGDDIEFWESVATVYVWNTAPGDALAQLLPALHAVVDSELAGLTRPAMLVAARAAADLASADPSSAQQHLDELTTLHSRLPGDTSSHESYGQRLPPAYDRALDAHWRAELGRVAGTEVVEHWIAAAAAWDKLARPHDAAYCRWRAAQAAFRDGQGTVAARLLNRAATDAREHVPLSEAIAATARVGR